MALWDLQTNEGLALCSFDGRIIATLLPPPTSAQFKAEQHFENELQKLAKQAKGIPLFVDQYICPGQYTLEDILKFIRYT